MATRWGAIGVFVFVGCGDVSSSKPDAAQRDAPSIDTPSIDAPTCVPSNTSMRARWRGNGNATEDSGIYNGTTVGGLAYAPGKHGMAFAFDGQDDGITADSTDQLYPVGSFTVELWVKTTNVPTTAGAPLIQKYECGGADACGASLWELFVTATSHPIFSIRVGSPASITASTSPITDGQWHHLAGVRDVTSKQLKLYVDGALAVSTTLSDANIAAMGNDDNVPDVLTIGSARSSGTNALYFGFAGALDNVGYYISALSDAEIAAIAAAPNGICP